MFSGLADSIMVMRLAIAPVRLTRWQIAKLIAKQIYRQISFLQLLFLVGNFFSTIVTIYLVVYRLLFHPLAKFPGPTLAAISEFWYIYHWLTGRYPWDLEKLHRKYGPVVRIAPNELSFASGHSATEIYGQAKSNSKSFSRVDRSPLDAGEARKALPRVLGAKFTKEGEAIVNSNVDAFISHLTAHGRPVNLQQWYGWLAFDIMGEMISGSSFRAVQQSMPHLWLEGMKKSAFNAGFTNVMQRLLPAPIFSLLLPYFSHNPGLASFNNNTSREIQQRSANKKFSNTSTPIDLLAQGSPGVNSDLLGRQANAIIQAGTQHMSLFLTSTTYHLLANPTTLAKATDEIRKSFSELRQISNASLQNLPYLAAVIEEGLRLIPTVPCGAPMVSHGAIVAGHAIPAGTLVSTCPQAIVRSPLNFTLAGSFCPQRWLAADDSAYERRFATDTLSASKPFGLGPHACPGIETAYLEARTVLAKTLWAFDLEVDGSVAGWERNTRYRGVWELPAIMVRAVPVVKDDASEVLV